jgi:predicted nucleic acid-binding protein
MILVDTSVWVDHLRSGNQALSGLLHALWALIRVYPC